MVKKRMRLSSSVQGTIQSIEVNLEPSTSFIFSNDEGQVVYDKKICSILCSRS